MDTALGAAQEALREALREREAPQPPTSQPQYWGRQPERAPVPAPELPRAWPLVQVQAQGLLQPRVVPGLEPGEAKEPRPPGQEPMAQRAAP